MEGNSTSPPNTQFGEVKLHELQLVKSLGKEQKKMEEEATSSPSNHYGDMDFSIFNMLKQPYCTKISLELSQRFVAQSECTIYGVYGHLRNINEKAYEPEVIAIGPYHRDKDNLKMMEEHKWRYLSLICKGEKKIFDKYCSAIEELEPKARKCYADSISLKKDEFVRMLVLDGCFIIELVRQVKTYGWSNPPTRMSWTMNSLQRDLMLFENQIPFFILCKLFELIEDQDQRDWLNLLRIFFTNFIHPTEFSNRSLDEDTESSIGLLIRFFRSICHVKENRENSNRSPDEGEECSDRSPYEIKHLLHLIRIELLSSFESDLAKRMNYRRKKFRDIKSATWLVEANVMFKRNEEAHSLFDIKFEHGTLLLPPLIIDDGTESLFRNLIAYEQYFNDPRSTRFMDRYRCVTDYVLFIDCLINSSGDVEILSHCDIIKNDLGNDEAPAKIFNKLTDSIDISDDDFIYGEIFDKLEEHCSKRWNRWMAKLRRDYFSSPWAIISFIAAAVLLLLTIAQTVFSALSLS